MDVALLCGLTPLRFKPPRIQLLRRTPTLRVGTRRCRRVGYGDGTTQIACDPREPNVRETGATVLGDEDILLQRHKFRRLGTGAEILPLSNYRGRALCYAGTEGLERRPPTATGLSQEMDGAKDSTRQLQRVRLELFPQELDDAPVFHPRRHHRAFLVIHHDPDQLQHVRVRQALPRYDLPAEILQTVRLGRGGKRSKIPTFFTFRISPDS